MIIGVALRHENGLVLFMKQPARHHDIIHRQYELTGKTVGGSYEQGFMTDTGEFLDRKTAWFHAWKTGQLLTEEYYPNLFSEELW